MTQFEIKELIKKLSEEDLEQVKNTIWFLKNDCISNASYIYNAFELVKLINNLKEKYER